jgi:hypothetical protein
MAAGGAADSEPSDQAPGRVDADEPGTNGTRGSTTGAGDPVEPGTGSTTTSSSKGDSTTVRPEDDAISATPGSDVINATPEDDATAGTREPLDTTSAPPAKTGVRGTSAANTPGIGADDASESGMGGTTGKQEDPVTPAAPGSARASATADAVGAAAAVAGSAPAAREGARTGSAAGARGAATGGDILDGPLLSDAAELRTNWLQVQARFVDDPPEAVSDAADLVEHTAQALVGALRLRQQQLRQMWDSSRPRDGGRGVAGDGDEPTAAAADSTEQLRLLMKRYRVLFNQICSP